MRAFLCLLALLLACGGPSRSPAPPHLFDSPNNEPLTRLGDSVVPKSYELFLQVNAESIHVRGRVIIYVEVSQPVDTIWLHQRDLTIVSATIAQEGLRDAPAIALESKRHDDRELLSVHSPESLAPGTHALEIEFISSFGDSVGIFHQQQQGRWYAYSDFEPQDARSAFPCFDDPRFRVPWSVTLDVPVNHKAFSNAPLAERTTSPAGFERYIFEQTPPLPSYLVALAAGPFDVKASHVGELPVRIIAPVGQAHKGAFVLANIGQWLGYLETYLDQKMPFRKLDLVAIPHFSGAMENAGLVTYHAPILLLDDEPGSDAQDLAAGVTAHELAHMWFGNNLTPDYWNELWLNEGFATWLSTKVVQDWKKLRGTDTNGHDTHPLEVADKSLAYDAEFGLNPPQVRQPVQSAASISKAFNPITYRKGGAILRHLEVWLGAELMQKLVRYYAARYQSSTVTTASLYEAIRTTLTTNLRDGDGFPMPDTAVKELAQGHVQFIDGLLNRPGLPVVRVSCIDKTLRVRTIPSLYAPEWDVSEHPLPVFFRVGAGDGKQVSEAFGGGYRLAMWLNEQSKGTGIPCIPSLHPNFDEEGYYLYEVSAERFKVLAEDDSHAAESILLAKNLWQAYQREAISTAQLLDIYEALAKNRWSKLHEELLPQWLWLKAYVLTAEESLDFEQSLGRWYQPRIQSLGLADNPTDSDETRRLRAIVLRLLAEVGRDKNAADFALAESRTLLMQKALPQTSEQAQPRSKLHPSYLEAILQAAASQRSEAFLPLLPRALARTTDNLRLAQLLSARMRLSTRPEAAGAIADAIRHGHLQVTTIRDALDLQLLRSSVRGAFWNVAAGALDEASGEAPDSGPTVGIEATAAKLCDPASIARARELRLTRAADRIERCVERVQRMKTKPR